MQSTIAKIEAIIHSDNLSTPRSPDIRKLCLAALVLLLAGNLEDYLAEKALPVAPGKVACAELDSPHHAVAGRPGLPPNLCE